MENAVKALLIAAGVLIGVMVLSLGITLLDSLSEYSVDTQKQIDANARQKFNEQFTRYIDTNLTIQDVVTAANAAYENNTKNGLTESSDNNYYVIVNMPENNNLEQNIDEKISQLLKDYSKKKYECTEENIKIKHVTGRVCEVTFTEISE